MTERPRAADDFSVIGPIYKKLIEVPEPKRSGSGAAGMHCAHCPLEPDAHCSKSCSEEAGKAGVVAMEATGRYWCPQCMSHRIIGCGGSECPSPYSGCAFSIDRVHFSVLGERWDVPGYYNGIFVEDLLSRGQLGLVGCLEADPDHVYSYRGTGVSPQEFAEAVRVTARRFGVVC